MNVLDEYLEMARAATDEIESLRSRLDTTQEQLRRCNIDQFNTEAALESADLLRIEAVNACKKAEARLAEAEGLLWEASCAIDDRLSGLPGDPLQPLSDRIHVYRTREQP